MKRFMDAMVIRSWLRTVALTLGVVMLVGAAAAGTFSRSDNVAFAGAADDNGNFWTPTVIVGSGGAPANLVNGENSDMFFNSVDRVQALRFPLGGDWPQRYLSRVDIWMRGYDSARKAYNYTLLVSSNNIDWVTVANSGFQNPDALASSLNLARFDFADPETTRGFRYLIVSNNHASVLYAARLSEIDIYTGGGDSFRRVDNATFAGSSDDAIQGRMGYAIRGLSIWTSDANKQYISAITDGIRQGFYFHTSDGLASSVTQYLLGHAHPDRTLSGVDIWMSGADGARKAYDYTVLSSTDGESWSRIGSSGYVNPVTATDNLARFVFEDPEASRGIQYLIISNNVATGTRITEIDVFTENDPVHVQVDAMALDQSWTDEINGLLPTTVDPWGDGGLSALTDATAADTPSGMTYPNIAGTVTNANFTWTVGTGKASHYLSRLDFWLDNTAAARGRHRFTIQTSNNGTTFLTVADSGYTAASTFTTDDTYRVRVDFDAGTVHSFTHVRMLTWPVGSPSSAPPGGATLYTARIREIDLFTDWLPSSGTLLLLR